MPQYTQPTLPGLAPAFSQPTLPGMDNASLDALEAQHFAERGLYSPKVIATLWNALLSDSLASPITSDEVQRMLMIAKAPK